MEYIRSVRRNPCISLPELVVLDLGCAVLLHEHRLSVDIINTWIRQIIRQGRTVSFLTNFVLDNHRRQISPAHQINPAGGGHWSKVGW